MINFNGTVHEDTQLLEVTNRGFAYGDALFETLKVVHNKLLFWEDHYFRLMASMRILRMEIPMNFTMEFLQEEILNLIEANGYTNSSVRLKLTVYRDSEGLYLPKQNTIGYLIQASPIANDFYLLDEAPYVVDLYKDFFVAPGLLSSLKTNNKVLHVTGSIYAKENDFDNCLLLNTNKQVIEALNGNIFLVKGNTIKTPPIVDGCLKGIMRKQLLDILATLPEEYTVTEASISPFELQQADELFITNVITGIQPVSNYRKKQFTNAVAKKLVGKLNTKIRLT